MLKSKSAFRPPGLADEAIVCDAWGVGVVLGTEVGIVVGIAVGMMVGSEVTVGVGIDSF